MKRLLLLFGLATAMMQISACKPAAGDDVDFVGREFDRSEVRVHVVTHKTLEDLRRAAEKSRAVVAQDRNLMAFGIVRGSDQPCEVHVLEPEKDAATRLWLGHEVAHCLWGRWHDPSVAKVQRS